MLFGFSRQIGRLMAALRAGSGGGGAGATRNPGRLGGLLFQFIVAVYGGFFGAGQGILMLASLSIQGVEDIQEPNALKNWISAVTYTVAALTFIAFGAVSWLHTLVMLVFAGFGGYGGAQSARRLPASLLRYLVITVGCSLTLIYFAKTYF